MKEEKRKPLVLIVDDDREFREEILPKEFERLGTRVMTAANPDEALKVISEEHDIRSNDPFDLAIIDMHMPMSSKTTITTNAGVQTLHFYKSFQLCVECPTVIFTAYPSYRNCVEAAKAGAIAYIPKMIIESESEVEEEGGLDDLINTCRRLLFNHRKIAVEPPPTNDWLKKNGDWLHSNFHGKWVTFIPEAFATNAGFVDRKQYPLQDGIILVSGSSFEEVRRVILQNPTLYQELPIIVKIEPTDQDIFHEMEE